MTSPKLSKILSTKENEEDEPKNELEAKSSDERVMSKRGYTIGRLLGEGAYAKVMKF